MEAILAILAVGALTPSPRQFTSGPAETLGLAHGFLDIDTPDFSLRLVKDSQTVAAMKPKGGRGFDFTPGDRLSGRATDGYCHLGDITLRLRTNVLAPWQEYSTATKRSPVTPLPSGGNTLAAADLAATLPAGCPLKIVRSWRLVGKRLALEFELTNSGTTPIELGSLGIPLVFNNIITGRSLQQAHEICSFSDPYIGQDAGYLQVRRLSGHGPALLVAPVGKTPFEAYQLMREPMRPNQTFEGTFAWMAHSKAYAEQEWNGVKQWNSPTSETIEPGKSRRFGVQFLLSDTIRHMENTLSSNGRPVAVGIPGYILPADQDGKLFLKYAHPVKSFDVDPPGALTFAAGGKARHGWSVYRVTAKGWGRARLTLTYSDGLTQSISYYLTKPAAKAVDDLGRFLTTKQWFDDPNDPFHRAPSVISYDREADAQVKQDSRVWIAGLGDEAGSGSWLAAAMKEFGRPVRSEIAKYEQFVDRVLWGGIQFKDGPNKFGVRKSMFYYDPKALPNFPYDKSRNWTSWTSWSKSASEDIGRAYNYPHVVAAYWVMYRLARNHTGLVKNHPWSWYLSQAYETTRFLTATDSRGQSRVGYIDTGLMEGDVFLALLDDLKREGWSDKAANVESWMKRRTDLWLARPYPFGSEMAWDSTGQEEIYAWCKHFGRDDKALVSLNSILGYMPTLPHWGYNGNARRYWDFLYGGKLSRIERQLHHYGSGLNALPVLTEYRQHPGDLYLLRVGYGGAMGALSNIDRQGFASAAFHSFPSTLKWDAYSGDYGPNFFGHAFNTGCYLIDHPDFGWQAFGGNVTVKGNAVRVKPNDSFRSRVYIAPAGLWLTLDAGTFEEVDYDPRTWRVRIKLARATVSTSRAILRLEQPAKLKGFGAYKVIGRYATVRGATAIPLKATTTVVVAR